MDQSTASQWLCLALAGNGVLFLSFLGYQLQTRAPGIKLPSPLIYPYAARSCYAAAGLYVLVAIYCAIRLQTYTGRSRRNPTRGPWPFKRPRLWKDSALRRHRASIAENTPLLEQHRLQVRVMTPREFGFELLPGPPLDFASLTQRR